MSSIGEWFFLGAVMIYTLVALRISYLSYRDYKEGIHALDYILIYFFILFLTGIFQFLTPFLKDKTIIFGLYQGIDSPLGYNPVRNLGIIAFLVLFVFAEHILSDEINKFRLSIVITFLAIYIGALLHYITTYELIYVNDVFPFAQNTRIDEFAYDGIAYTSLLVITYAFFKQSKQYDDSEFSSSLKIIYIALLVFTVSYLYEWMEHFFPIIDIDFVYFTIPLFIALAYVYTKTPHFSYLTPYDVHFLQISMNDGRLLYSANITNTSDAQDFFLTFSITNINALLTETLTSDNKGIYLENIRLNQGEIIFETVNDIILSIYTEKSSHILRRSMRYFIREFSVEYQDQIAQIRKETVIGSFDDPNALLRKCIPILSIKHIETDN